LGELENYMEKMIRDALDENKQMEKEVVPLSGEKKE
jgi:hypothetical protein